MKISLSSVDRPRSSPPPLKLSFRLAVLRNTVWLKCSFNFANTITDELYLLDLREDFF